MSNPTATPTPVSITKNSATDMVVEWNNGEKTLIPFIDLRFHCRCAECVDEWSRARRIRKADIKPDIKPMAVEQVGRYAIQIAWSDRHKAGIYPFELLYEIAKGVAK